MLQFVNLSKSYSSQLLFEDVSLTISPGERVGLVGRNGHGKSTLFKVILGKEELDEGLVKIPANYRISYLEQHISFEEGSVLKEASLARGFSIRASYTSKKS